MRRFKTYLLTFNPGACIVVFGLAPPYPLELYLGGVRSVGILHVKTQQCSVAGECERTGAIVVVHGGLIFGFVFTGPAHRWRFEALAHPRLLCGRLCSLALSLGIGSCLSCNLPCEKLYV